MKIKLQTGESIEIPCRKVGFFGKFSGLMFSRREKAEVLLFDMKKPMAIHSFFVFFDFIAVWIDEKNTVVKWKIVKPWSPYEMPEKHFSKLIEIPISRRYHNIVALVVGERFKKEYRL
ncbi:MAG: hypothetical protein WC796_05990 [Candidatus Pacearchaeota archaeon]|jgi:uncharacterized membrane protein (UPF0127 family)